MFEKQQKMSVPLLASWKSELTSRRDGSTAQHKAASDAMHFGNMDTIISVELVASFFRVKIGVENSYKTLLTTY
jgi:hypothetical protein